MLIITMMVDHHHSPDNDGDDEHEHDEDDDDDDHDEYSDPSQHSKNAITPQEN